MEEGKILFCNANLKLMQIFIPACGSLPTFLPPLPLKFCISNLWEIMHRESYFHIFPLFSAWLVMRRGQREICQMKKHQRSGAQKMFKLGHLPLENYKKSKIILVTHRIMSVLNISLGLDHWFSTWLHNGITWRYSLQLSVYGPNPKPIKPDTESGTKHWFLCVFCYFPPSVKFSKWLIMCNYRVVKHWSRFS